MTLSKFVKGQPCNGLIEEHFNAQRRGRKEKSFIFQHLRTS